MKLVLASILALLPVAAHAQTATDATKTYIDGAFAAMDGNRNGQVDPAEFDTFMRARLARQAQAFDAAFAGLDTNSDGGIDKGEAAAHSALVANFTAVDTDGNGKISKDELRTAMIAAQAAEAGVR